MRVNEVTEHAARVVEEGPPGSYRVEVVTVRTILIGSSKAMADTVAKRYEEAYYAFNGGKPVSEAKARAYATFKTELRPTS